MQRRDEAIRSFKTLLKRYPNGNKADAARFKLRLMELEERLALKQPERKPGGDEDTTALLKELAGLRERETGYKEEIAKLNNELDYLKTQLDTLEAIANEQGDLQERIEKLISWENVLGLKEQALDRKEQELDRQYESIQEAKRQIEGGTNE
jgi:chromosome segregation ATPase